MKHKRVKGYWLKRQERYPDALKAQSRAGSLRMHEHTSHVRVRPTKDGFEVSFSIAKWYLDELPKAGGVL
jgi:hypothetical protein